MVKPRDTNTYKYCYIVNLKRGEGQMFPTFSPVIREPLTNKFPRISGEVMSDMALYYTDEQVDEDDLKNMAKHTTLVMRGGANVLRPDSDDAELLRRVKESGQFSAETFQQATDNAAVLAAEMAADGHFKFNFL